MTTALPERFPKRLGDYELLEELRRGATGTVYRARHVRLGRDVTVKVLSDAYVRAPSLAEQFDREMRAVGALDHPNPWRTTLGRAVSLRTASSPRSHFASSA